MTVQGTLVVEPLTSDVLDLVRCMLIDAEAFPRPSMQFGRELHLPHARVWIARLESRGPVVGFAGTRSRGGEVDIIGLATDRAFRKAGIGGALLDAVIADATVRRRLRIVLQVAKSNQAAISLYSGRGFRATKLFRGYYPDGEDAYQMVCSPLSAPGGTPD
jgi:[ribosomal protein S18]-alanine N-acetyltransferase